MSQGSKKSRKTKFEDGSKVPKPSAAGPVGSNGDAPPITISVEERVHTFQKNNTRQLAQILAFEDAKMLSCTTEDAAITEFKRKLGSFLAMDCEFVGTGLNGSTSELGRVSIVNYYGVSVYDQYVLPTSYVTDFRTKYSGITPHHLKGAITFKEAQQKVSDLLEKKTLVGHGIKNDLRVLLLSHPRSLVIDTQILQRFKTDQRIKGRPGLKKLLDLYFGMSIQVGSHDSVEDARSTMFLFRVFKDEFLKEKRR